MEKEFDRRSFLKVAGIGALTVASAGALAACGSSSSSSDTSSSSSSTDSTSIPDGYGLEMTLAPTALPDITKASNFDVVTVSKTTVGTTYENLLTALQGETNATTKYSAFAKVAESAGFTQAARLFNCAADAEKIHIELEFALASKIDSTTQRPTGATPTEEATDLNVITGANGEIYETSDMYPSFIKVAQQEGNDEAVQIFSRAKMAEGYHAQRYLDAYNNLDTPSDDKYYLCPVCGYIHKGENFTACPICLTPKSSFVAY